MNSLIHVLRSQASNNLGYGRANRVKLPFGVIAVNCAAKYFSTPRSPLGPLLYHAKRDHISPLLRDNGLAHSTQFSCAWVPIGHDQLP